MYNETGKVEPSEEMVKTDIKADKTHKLCDNVILIATGNNALTETILVESKKRVSKESTLNEVRMMMFNIMTDIKEGKVEYLNEILSNLEKEIPYLEHNPDLVADYWDTVSSRIDDPRGLSAYLVGFSDDGTSGLVDVRSNKLMNCESSNGGYPVVIAGDVVDSRNQEVYQQVLGFPKEQRTMNEFMSRMLIVHSHISKSRNHVNVSKECKFKILSINRKNQKVEYHTHEIDSFNFYQPLGINGEP